MRLELGSLVLDSDIQPLCHNCCFYKVLRTSQDDTMPICAVNMIGPIPDCMAFACVKHSPLMIRKAMKSFDIVDRSEICGNVDSVRIDCLRHKIGTIEVHATLANS